MTNLSTPDLSTHTQATFHSIVRAREHTTPSYIGMGNNEVTGQATDL